MSNVFRFSLVETAHVAQQDDWNGPTAKNTTKTDASDTTSKQTMNKKTNKTSSNCSTENIKTIDTFTQPFRSHGHQTRNEIHQTGTIHSERAVSCRK